MCRVLPSIFDMFEGGSAAEKLVTDIQQVIGFAVGQFEFQYRNGIERINESALLDDLMVEGEASVGGGVCLVGHFESNESGGKLWCAEGGVQAICSEGDFLLVGVEKIG